MILRQVVTTGVAAILLTGLSLTASQAQFATFGINNTAGSGTLHFTSAGVNSHLNSGSTSVEASTSVNFIFQQNVGSYTAGQTISATLDVFATVAAPATQSTSHHKTFDTQSLQNISLVFTQTTGAHKKLLEIQGGSSTGTLTGQDGGTLAAVSAGSTNGFIYTSDFLTFGSNNNNSYSLGLSLLQALGYSSNYLTAFTTSGVSGQFYADTANPIPEASTLLAFGGMLTGGGLLCLRQRRIRRMA